MATTNSSGALSSSRGYRAYGNYRRGGDLPTDYRFTGQQQDASGLVYMNARYYDPVLGQFISPDTLVPDAGRLIDYNRYGYARGNPLSYSNPSEHAPQCEVGASAYEQEWMLWRQYEETQDVWSAWEDFLAGYRHYQNYCEAYNPSCRNNHWWRPVQCMRRLWCCKVSTQS